MIDWGLAATIAAGITLAVIPVFLTVLIVKLVWLVLFDPYHGLLN